jgi:protein-disulfide isomerase/uncharacterized membrane protein
LGSSATTRLVAALGLCLAAAAVSGLLLLQHHGERGAVTAVSEVCGDGQTNGCEEVARSSWSKVGGMPLAGLGLVFYLSVGLALALGLAGPADLRDPVAAVVVAALGLGLVVDAGLLAVQAFAIHAFCRLCLATYALGAVALAALLPAWRAARTTQEAAARPESRLLASSWAAGALLAAAAVVAANGWLAERAARRQAGLLGAPVTAPAAAGAPAAAPPAAAAPVAAPAPEATLSPAPAPPPLLAAPGGPQDAKYWQDRAQKLQETLDDPRKLEAYFTQKAQHEYDTAAVESIDVSEAPLRGPAKAPVKVVEYSDFLCPFCRNLAGALVQFIPQAGGRVAVYFKNYPLDAQCNPKLTQSTHPGSCNLALGAVCAQRQGKFEAYHDRVFSTDLRNPTVADVVRVAGEAGLNGAALQGCIEDPKTRQTLEGQIAEANRLGVNATPTLYVNGKKLPRINDFVAVVDKEARKKGFPPLAPGQ